MNKFWTPHDDFRNLNPTSTPLSRKRANHAGFVYYFTEKTFRHPKVLDFLKRHDATEELALACVVSFNEIFTGQDYDTCVELHQHILSSYSFTLLNSSSDIRAQFSMDFTHKVGITPETIDALREMIDKFDDAVKTRFTSFVDLIFDIMVDVYAYEIAPSAKKAMLGAAMASKYAVKALSWAIYSTLSVVVGSFVTHARLLLEGIQAQASAHVFDPLMSEKLLTSVFGFVTGMFTSEGQEGLLEKVRAKKIIQASNTLRACETLLSYCSTLFSCVIDFLALHFGEYCPWMVNEESFKKKTVSWLKDTDKFFIAKAETGEPTRISLQYDKEKMALVNGFYEGQQLLRHFPKEESGFLFSAFNARLNAIQAKLETIENFIFKDGQKVKPCVLYVFGEPGKGKSTMIDPTMDAMFRVGGLGKYDKNAHRYEKPQTTKYWEGYNYQPIYVLDDFLQVLDPATRAVQLGDFIAMTTDVPFPLDFAHIESKGNKFFHSEFIILTSNTEPKKATIEKIITSGDAFERRVDYFIKPVPDKSILDANGHVDPVKVGNTKFEKFMFEISTEVGGNALSVTFKEMVYMISARRQSKLDELDRNCDALNDVDIKEIQTKLVANTNFKVPAAQMTADSVEPLIVEKEPSTSDLKESLELEDADVAEIQEKLAKLKISEIPKAQMDVVKDVAKAANTWFWTPYGAYAKAPTRAEAKRKFDTTVFEPYNFKETLEAHYHAFMEKMPYHNGDPLMAVRNFFQSPNFVKAGQAMDPRVETPKEAWDTIVGGLGVIPAMGVFGISKMGEFSELILQWFPQYMGFRFLAAFFIVNPLVKTMVIGIFGLVKRLISSMVGAVQSMVHRDGSTIKFPIDTIQHKNNLAPTSQMHEEADAFHSHVCPLCFKVWTHYHTPSIKNWDHCVCSGCKEKAGGGVLEETYNRHIEKQSKTSTRNGTKRVSEAKQRKMRAFSKRNPYIAAQATSVTLDKVYAELRKNLSIKTYTGHQALPSCQLEMNNCEVNAYFHEKSTDPSAVNTLGAVIPNIGKLRCMDTGNSLSCLRLKGDLVIFPYHLIIGLDTDTVKFRYDSSTSTRVVFVRNMEDIMIDENNDIALMRLPSDIPLARDIIKHFANEEDVKTAIATAFLPRILAGANSTSVMVSHLEGLSRPIEPILYSLAEDTMMAIERGWTYKGVTFDGDCGAPIIAIDKGMARKIVGVHVAGTTGSIQNGRGNFLTQEYINSLVEEFSSGNDSPTLQEPTVKSQFYDEFDRGHIAEGDETVDLLGHTSVMLFANPKTQLVPSLINGVFPITAKPALLANKTVDGIYRKPLEEGVRAGFAPDLYYEREDIMIDAENLTFEAIEELPQAISVEKRVLSNQEAVMGLRGYEDEKEHYLGPMNLKTSPGFPFIYDRPGTKKSDYIEITESGAFTMNGSLEKTVEDHEKLLKDNVVPFDVYVECLKDEKRPIEKWTKARVFSIPSFTTVILVRKYFLMFLAHLMFSHVAGECAVGINVHSDSWARLAKRLSKQKKIIAGDYSKWDKRLPYQLAIRFASIVNRWYGDCERNQRVRRNLCIATFASYKLVKGKLIRSHHGMPSGVPFTAVGNSVINSLIMNVAYLALAEDAGFDREMSIKIKKRDVHSTFFGDDHAISVSDSVLEFFNMVSIRHFLKDNFGMIYTDVEKTDDDSRLSYCLEEVGYLKRKFRVEGTDVFAPLELDVIHNTLNFVKNSVDPKEAIVNMVDVIALELVHHGKEQFDHSMGIIEKACRREEIDIPAVTYASQLVRLRSGDVQDGNSGSSELNLFLNNAVASESHHVTGKIRDTYGNITECDWCYAHQDVGNEKHHRCARCKRMCLRCVYGAKNERLCPGCAGLFDEEVMPAWYFHDPNKCTESHVGIRVQMQAADTGTSSSTTVHGTDKLGSGQSTEDALETTQFPTVFRDQADVEVTEPLQVDAIQSRPVNPYPIVSLTEFLARPFLVKTIVWKTDSAGVISHFDLPMILFEQDAVWKKLQNFNYFRADIELEFRVNGIQFQYGTLQVSSFPCSGDLLSHKLLTGSYNNIVTLSACDSLYLGPTESTTKVMKVPWNLPKHYLNLRNLVEISQNKPYISEDEMLLSRMSTIVVTVLNPLNAVGECNSPVTVSVFARMTNIDLAGYSPQCHTYTPIETLFEYDMVKFNTEALFADLDMGPTTMETLPTKPVYPVVETVTPTLKVMDPTMSIPPYTTFSFADASSSKSKTYMYSSPGLLWKASLSETHDYSVEMRFSGTDNTDLPGGKIYRVLTPIGVAFNHPGSDTPADYDITFFVRTVRFGSTFYPSLFACRSYDDAEQFALNPYRNNQSNYWDGWTVSAIDNVYTVNDLRFEILTPYSPQAQVAAEHSRIMTGVRKAVRIARAGYSAVSSVMPYLEYGLGIAAMFGFSNPNDQEKITNVRIEYPTLALMEGSTNHFTVGAVADAQIKPLAPIDSSNPMLIHNVIGRYGLLTTFDISPEDEVGTIVFSTHNSPMNCTYEKALQSDEDGSSSQKYYKLRHTPLSFVASCFALWRGSITYKFQMVSSSFQSVRIRIGWVPSGLWDDAYKEDTDLVNTVNTVVDVQTNTEYELTIPFLRDYHYATVGPLSDNVPTSCGIIYMSIVNTMALPCGGDPSQFSSNVHVNIFVKGEADFQFSKPTGRYLSTYNRFPSWSLRANSGPQAQVDIIASTSSREDGVCCPESIVSVKTLANRYGLVGNLPLVEETKTSVVAVLLNSESLTYPSALNNAKTFNALPSSSSMSFRRYLMQMYRFTRGSINYRYIRGKECPTAIAISAFVANDATVTQYMPSTSDSRIGTFGILSDSAELPLTEGTQLNLTPEMSGCSANVPYYSNVSMIPHQYNTSIQSVNKTFGLVTTLDPNENLLGSDGARIVESAGDDFEYVAPIGPPSLLIPEAAAWSPFPVIAPSAPGQVSCNDRPKLFRFVPKEQGKYLTFRALKKATAIK